MIEIDLVSFISSFFYESVMTNSTKRLSEVEKDWNKLFFTIKYQVTLLGDFEYSISCWFILVEAILIFVNNIIFVIKFWNFRVKYSFKDFFKNGWYINWSVISKLKVNEATAVVVLTKQYPLILKQKSKVGVLSQSQKESKN